MDEGGDSLAKYRQKRNFSKTKEPEGIVAKPGGNRYLIQKHAATRLHYDFRLEVDGVLKSWAVTRGPSPNPDDKRLAVQTEDHPVAYGRFEGTIPESEYGGGTVMLWDEGTWEPIGDPNAGLEKGDFKFILHGNRLHGSWVLARMKSRPQDRGRSNWLLIKHRDEGAFDDDAEAWLEANATSVVSQRTMDEIAADQDNVWHSGQAEDSRMAGGPEPKTPKTGKAKIPAKPKTSAAAPVKSYKPLKFMTPELATLADAVPEGPNWVHEIKFDGYRTMALIEQGEVRMLTRSGLDWTHKYQAIADALKGLGVGQALLDGEVVALNDDWASSFQKLKNELGAERSENLQYYVFDLLVLDGENLTRLPLLDRKARLKELLGRQDLHDRVFYSEHFAENAEFLPRVCSLEMEGIISKRIDSTYSGKRGEAWLKVKCHKRQEFVIVGFTESEHAGRGFRSLLLGYYDSDGALQFSGKVGTGFNSDSLRNIRDKLDALKVVPKLFKKLPPDVGRGTWVEPKLVCEIEFTEWTDEGRLRHPSFQGLREDKKPEDVHRDRELPVATAQKDAEAEVAAAPAAEPVSVKAAPRRTTVKDRDRIDVAGVSVSHPDRVVYPLSGETKLDVVEYYHQVADQVLPHIVNRPLSLLRAPDTIDGQQFFQRHLPDKGRMDDVYPVKIATRKEEYLMIKDERGLLSLAQWGGVELHPWGCRADDPLKPDRMIFDLDPDPEAGWENVIEGASEIRERMRELGLESFLKTTGGKGLHVVVPIEPKYGWPAIKSFCKAIADSMAADDPKRFLATMSKAARKGRIFVDYLRNDLTSTAAAAFSLRARPGATVSTPLAWSELRPALKPSDFNIHTVPPRVAKQKADPWADFFEVKQTIKADYLKALKIEAK